MIIGGTPDNLIVEGSMVNIHKIIFDKLGYCFSYAFFTGRGKGLGLREADMYGTPVIIPEDHMTGEEEQSVFVYADEWSAMYRRPAQEPDIAGFIKPYTALVWWLLSASFLGLLACLWVVRFLDINFLKIYRRADRMDSNGRAPVGMTTFTSDNVFVILAVLFMQSIPTVPQGGHIRIAIALWLLVSFVLASVYRSNLKAMLILPTVNLPFDDTEELVDTGLPLRLPFGSFLHRAMLEAPPGSSFSRLLPKNDSIYLRMDLPTSIRAMENGEVVFAAPRTVIRNVMHRSFSETGRCLSYVMSENLVGMTFQTFVFRKSSQLKAKIDPLIVKLQQSGIMDYIVKKATANATECLKPLQSQYQYVLRPLELRDFYGVFLLYAGGVFTGILTLLIELALAKSHNFSYGLKP
ncbi:glutamate receptor ionotropic, NMDA 1-like isoform X2 [Penaeus chinensis]|uniref:glutamate receptor ionotropic, NMDA 1-like isoform X2 n=1 Tax=Penaeus chinensis TaxID=139456 RepID=UPI001FB85841|nr:glutamate receptor ionotropic, NMDA 1-like isoform X2 [Penaeus chinensis]